MKITLTVGGKYQIEGSGGKNVTFKFLHANDGKPAFEIDGQLVESDTINGLVAPEEIKALYIIDAPTHFVKKA